MGKRVYPIPPRIKKETQQLLDADVVAEIKAWIEVHTTGIDDHNLATNSSKLREDISAAIPAAEQNESAMRRANIFFERRNNKRFCTYLYPGQTAPQAVLLNVDS